MIILYEYTETAFNNNGLGCLNDATSCVVSETLNGEYELEMEYPVNGIHYSDIQLRRIIFAKPNSYDREQPFRIYSISKPIGGLVTVNAEHISYDMSGLPVRGAIEHYAWYVKDVFDHIKNNSVYPCPFTFSSDITEEKKEISLSKPRSVKAFLGTDEGLLSLFGGEWEFDRYNAILHKERGQNRGVSIEYGKNLTDVTQDEACSEMYTAVYPYYYQEDDGLQRLDEDVVKILDTTYNNVCILDLTSEFDEMPTQDQLRAKTQEYIKDNKLGEPKVSLKVSFIKNPEVIEALQDVRLGDTVGVKFIKIGVDTTSRCINYEFNVLTEQYNSIGLGEPTKTIVDTMTSTSSRIDEANSAIDDTQDNLYDEIDRATDAEGVLSTRIDKTDSDITLEVTRAKGSEESLGSRITQTAEAITAEVTRAQGAEESLGSTITQTAEQIALKVSKGDVSSQLSLESGEINISGNRLIIDCGNFFLDSNGNAGIKGSLLYDYGEYSNYEILSHDGQYRPMVQAFTGTFDYLNVGEISGYISADYAASAGSASSATNATNATYLKNGVYVYISDKGNFIPSSDSIDCGTKTHPFKTGWTVDGWKTTSDERLKKDFVSLKDDHRFEAMFYLLDPMEYKFKNDKNGKVHVGFSAQKVKTAMYSAGIEENEFFGYIHEYSDRNDFDSEEAYEEFLVRNNGNSDCYGLSYQEFIPINTCMIQKQHQEIESLKIENLQIKGELDILKQRLKRLEEKLC